MNNVPTARFTEFIEFFPLLELPISLLPDLQQISSDNEPVPAFMIDAFILPFEGDEMDQYTEYMPFGRIDGTKGYHALIYWKAGVMRYEFILATYSDEGQPLSHAIIGGLKYEQEGMLHSVAVINEDMSILIAEGMTDDENESFDMNNTSTYQMTIQADGSITYDVNEESKER